MATLTQIRQGIGTNVSNNITSISVYNYTPDRSEPPLLIVGVLDNLEYDTTMQDKLREDIVKQLEKDKICLYKGVVSGKALQYVNGITKDMVKFFQNKNFK